MSCTSLLVIDVLGWSSTEWGFATSAVALFGLVYMPVATILLQHTSAVLMGFAGALVLAVAQMVNHTGLRPECAPMAPRARPERAPSAPRARPELARADGHRIACQVCCGRRPSTARSARQGFYSLGTHYLSAVMLFGTSLAFYSFGLSVTNIVIAPALAEHATASTMGAVVGVGAFSSSAARIVAPAVLGSLYEANWQYPYLAAAAAGLVGAAGFAAAGVYSHLTSPQVIERRAKAKELGQKHAARQAAIRRLARELEHLLETRGYQVETEEIEETCLNLLSTAFPDVANDDIDDELQLQEHLNHMRQLPPPSLAM